MHSISVCICTYKRPTLLLQLLDKLSNQTTEGLFNYSIVIVDNDIAQSAINKVTDFKSRSIIHTKYCVEPRQNIALARNMALEKADGDFIALIDDDESPDEDWLCNLYKSIESYNVDGVLGPVKPCFEDDPPDWVTNGKFFDRPTHESGYRIGLSDARTGNVLFRRRILDGVVSPFLEKFGTGGEDVDFFQRMMEKGFVFVWCNEAVVYESVPLSRCTRGSLLRRALLRGRNSLKLNTSYSRKLIKSIIALPVYSLALPFLFIAGEHHFMKYMIKFCDHAGRLLALLKLNPVKERTL